MRGWQVLGESTVTSRFEALRGSTPNPLIGRDEEIDLLLRRWAHATAGDGQIVLLSGEAGIGKSRLAAHLAAEVANEPHTRLRYQCSPYHRDSVLHPFYRGAGARRPPRPRGPGRDAARQARNHIGAGAHRRNRTALCFPCQSRPAAAIRRSH